MATRRAATKTVATTENTTKETAPVKTTKKFEQNELIECRSLVQGTLFMPGKQSDILYRWDGYGDIREVEYRDLYSLKSSRSPYIYDPCFQIENNLYDASDINQFLALSPAQFKKALAEVPKGLKTAIKIEVATRLDNGTFDSIQKVRAVDEICGTELEKMI